MSASFISAANKLLNTRGKEPFAIEDLPNDRNATIWSRIEEQYGLTIAEVSVLQNFSAPQPC